MTRVTGILKETPDRNRIKVCAQPGRSDDQQLACPLLSPIDVRGALTPIWSQKYPFGNLFEDR